MRVRWSRRSRRPPIWWAVRAAGRWPSCMIGGRAGCGTCPRVGGRSRWCGSSGCGVVRTGGARSGRGPQTAPETGARHSPGVSSQIGTLLSHPRIDCVYARRRHGPIRSSGRVSDGSPYGLRWRRGPCVPVGRVCDSQGYWVVSASRLSPSATEGVASERGTWTRHRQLLSIRVPQAPRPTATTAQSCRIYTDTTVFTKGAVGSLLVTLRSAATTLLGGQRCVIDVYWRSVCPV
jgi:hypothetical protein